jgi:hypothetical protein
MEPDELVYREREGAAAGDRIVVEEVIPEPRVEVTAATLRAVSHLRAQGHSWPEIAAAIGGMDPGELQRAFIRQVRPWYR